MDAFQPQVDDPGASDASTDHQPLLTLLDNAPVRPSHYLIWLQASGGVLLDGASIFVLGITLPLLHQNLALTTWETSVLAAVLVSGAAIGAAIGGRLADRIGRKPVFLLDMALLAAAALLSALAGSPFAVIVGQWLVGVAIGLDFPVGSSFVAECMPVRVRSRMMVATIGSQAMGMILASGLALGLLHWVENFSVWRWLFAAEALAAVIFLIARLQMPESPRWLMGEGRNREAVQMLRRFVQTDPQLLESMAKQLGATPHYAARTPLRSQRLSVLTLFEPAYLRRTLLSTTPWFLMDIAAYGVGLFTPALLAALHLGAAPQNVLAQTDRLASGTGIVDIFLLIGFLLGAWAVPRYGRIPMQMAGFAGMAIAMGVLMASNFTQGGGFHMLLIFIGFIVFNLSMNMGPNSTTYILPAELFPTQLRATGVGFAAASAKVGATLGVFSLPLLQSTLGVSAVLMLMVVVSISGLIATWVFAIHTGLLTLEEHQSSALP